MAERPVAWHQAWYDALYAPSGFYRRALGPGRHFSTSMQGVPHAPVIMARALSSLARRHGLTTLIDVGAHRGELAQALLQVGSTLRYVGVDINPAPSHTAGIDHWLQSPGGAALPPELRGIRDALVLAHEWLDVVPAVIATAGRDGRWRQLWVDPSTGEPAPGPPVSELDQDWLTRWAGPEVLIAEVGRSRDDAFADLVGRVEHGLVLMVDYGHHLHTRPADGTLRGYRGGRQLHPVPDGSMDLTADVAIDSLCSALEPYPRWAAPQHDAVDDLLGAPGNPDASLARQDPAAYLDALAHTGAHRTLAAPESFGGFWWVCVDRTH